MHALYVLGIHNEEGTVLVHCAQGKSRSVTLTTAYLIALTDMNWNTALNGTKKRRSH